MNHKYSSLSNKEKNLPYIRNDPTTYVISKSCKLNSFDFKYFQIVFNSTYLHSYFFRSVQVASHNLFTHITTQKVKRKK